MSGKKILQFIPVDGTDDVVDIFVYPQGVSPGLEAKLGHYMTHMVPTQDVPMTIQQVLAAMEAPPLRYEGDDDGDLSDAFLTKLGEGFSNTDEEDDVLDESYETIDTSQ